MIFLGRVSIESAILLANVSPLFVNLLRAAFTRERDAVCGSYVSWSTEKKWMSAQGLAFTSPSPRPLCLCCQHRSLSLYFCHAVCRDCTARFGCLLATSRCPRSPLLLLATATWRADSVNTTDLIKKNNNIHTATVSFVLQKKDNRVPRDTQHALLKACRLFFCQMSWLVWHRVWCQPP